MSYSIAKGQDQQRVAGIRQRLSSYQPIDAIYAYDSIATIFKDVQPDSALKYAHAGLAIAVKINDSTNVAYYYTLIGVLHKNLAAIDSAVWYYEHAIIVQTGTRFYKGIAGNYNNLATVYKLAGKYSRSLYYYRKALGIMRDRYHDEGNTNVIYQNMADLFIEQGQNERAEEILGEAERYYNRIGYKGGIANVNLSKAELYKHKNPEDAIGFTETAIRLYKQEGRTKDYLQAMIMFARIQSLEHHYEEASRALNTVITLAAQHNLQRQQAEALQKLGELSFDKKDYNAAHDLAQKSLKIASSLKIMKLMVEDYQLLSAAAEKTGHHEAAFNYLKQFNRLNDSLNNVQLRKDFNQLEIKYSVAEREQKIIRLQDSAQIQKLQSREQNLELKRRATQNILLLAIVLIVIVFAGLLIYRYIQKQRLSVTLQKALSERDILLKEVHHRVKNNLQIINSLLNLQNETGENRTVAEVVKLTQDRVYTMSIIHEKLYRSDDLLDISLEEYVASLCTYYNESYGLSQKNITITTDIRCLENISIDRLITLGLILNELLVNCIKYAFGEEGGMIVVRCVSEEGFINFSVSDNGKGLPKDFEERKEKSLGMQLVDGLVAQLKAKMKIAVDNGTTVSLKFKTGN